MDGLEDDCCRQDNHEVVQRFLVASPAEKVAQVFSVFDKQGNGKITKTDFECCVRLCCLDGELELTDCDVRHLSDKVFHAASQDDVMTLADFKIQLEKYPDILENLNQRAISMQSRCPPKRRYRFQRYFTRRYIQNHLKRVVFLFLFFIINIVLFTISAVRYRHHNCCIIIARGCGMCLNFNCAFVLVPMLRNTLTLLRATRAASYLPLDDHVYLHKVVGVVICAQTFVHTVTHLINIEVTLCHQVLNITGINSTHQRPFTFWEYLFSTEPDIGWLDGMAPLSGVIADVLLCVLFLCSLDFIRRKGFFQVFYWTHMIYVLFWVFLFIHAPSFWCFFIVPLFLFVIEKVSRSRLVKMVTYGRTYITEAVIHSSKVTHLVIPRPSNFSYRPGDYVFIQIPYVARQEWHPFTISSAPEMPDYLWLHVRSAGNWTNKVYEYFSQHPISLTYNNPQSIEQCISLQMDDNSCEDVNDNITGKKKVRVPLSIDGPYGTPSRGIFEAEHAVLIAAGIGVTPFASILQSIMYRHRASKQMCPSCSHEWYGNVANMGMNLKKVDFIWINRDRKSFEWFLNLLTQLELDQEHGESFDDFMTLNMYITAMFGGCGRKSLALQALLDLYHKIGNVDLITGLKSKTHTGRPNWDKILQHLQAEKRGKIEVFFCGSATLGKELRATCEKYRIRFHKERF